MKYLSFFNQFYLTPPQLWQYNITIMIDHDKVIQELCEKYKDEDCIFS